MMVVYWPCVPAYKRGDKGNVPCFVIGSWALFGK